MKSTLQLPTQTFRAADNCIRRSVGAATRLQKHLNLYGVLHKQLRFRKVWKLVLKNTTETTVLLFQFVNLPEIVTQRIHNISLVLLID